jgi:hypothetical protein
MMRTFCDICGEEVTPETRFREGDAIATIVRKSDSKTIKVTADFQFPQLASGSLDRVHMHTVCLIKALKDQI